MKKSKTIYDVCKHQRVKSIDFHFTLSLILIACFDGSIELHDYEKKELIHRYPPSTSLGAIRAVRFHPNRSIFASGGNDGTIKLYDFSSHLCIEVLKYHADYVRGLCFHTSLPLLISCSDDENVLVWDYEKKEMAARFTDTRCDHYMMSVDISSVAAMGRDDVIMASNIRNNVALWTLKSAQEHPKQTNWMTCITGKSTPCPSSTCANYMLQGHKKSVNAACFHPSKPLIATASDDHAVRLWNINPTVFDAPHEPWDKKNRILETAEVFYHHSESVSSVSFFHHNNDWIVSASEDGSCVVYDIKTHKLITRIFFECCETCVNTLPLEKVFVNLINKSRCWTTACHPDKGIFAVGHDRGFKIIELE